MLTALGLKAGDFAGGDLLRLVRRIIEDLDLQFVARIIELADRSNQSSNDVVLIIDRQLDSNRRESTESCRRLDAASPILQEQIDDEIAVNAKG